MIITLTTKMYKIDIHPKNTTDYSYPNSPFYKINHHTNISNNIGLSFIC